MDAAAEKCGNAGSGGEGEGASPDSRNQTGMYEPALGCGGGQRDIGENPCRGNCSAGSIYGYGFAYVTALAVGAGSGGDV